mgnify:FL=1
MKKQAIAFHLRLIRGAIGNKFVIKQTAAGPVFSKYPDMKKIVPSPLQVRQRALFKEAVTYAKAIMTDPVQKAVWEKKLPKGKKLNTQLIKKYMKESQPEE